MNRNIFHELETYFYWTYSLLDSFAHEKEETRSVSHDATTANWETGNESVRSVWTLIRTMEVMENDSNSESIYMNIEDAEKTSNQSEMYDNFYLNTTTAIPGKKNKAVIFNIQIYKSI